MRIDGAIRFVINSDQTYELTWLESKSVNRGLYEETGCYRNILGPDSPQGNVIFYTADGDSCCVSLRKLGGKTLIKHIAGDSFKICGGGVYEKQ